jgi:hypothetical protein
MIVFSLKGQITFNSDSMVYCKWNVTKDTYIPTKSIKENMLIEIDKDLLPLRIFGNNHEKELIEKAFIIDFREVSPDKNQWLFMGSDKNFKLYAVTLDVPKKQIGFISTGTDQGMDIPLDMFYYSISDIKINADAINKHLEEKGDQKY